MESRLGTLRAGREGCPSDLMLDRLCAGELSSEQQSELQSHLAACEVCPSRVAQRQAGFEAFPDLDTRPLLSAIVRRVGEAQEAKQRRFSVGKVLAWLAPVGAAVAVFLLIGRGRDREPADDQESAMTREKGSAALHVFRQVREGARESLSGDSFRPGEALRFVVDLSKQAQISVVGIEASGALYVAWPQDAGAVTLYSAGKGQALPGAVVLDESIGKETLYLVACPASLSVPAQQCKSGGPGALPQCGPGCSLSAFVLNKK